jgi:hypothetical protein
MIIYGLSILFNDRVYDCLVKNNDFEVFKKVCF